MGRDEQVAWIRDYTAAFEEGASKIEGKNAKILFIETFKNGVLWALNEFKNHKLADKEIEDILEILPEETKR